jgi:methylated-DNA-[protein]-cysteine S-methyltransferase
MYPTATWSTVETPVGPFSAVVDRDGVVLASGWTTEVGALLEGIAPALRPTGPRWMSDLGPVSRAVVDYHGGDLDVIDKIIVRQQSGSFLQHAWEVLRKVPAGEPVSYREYAALTGRPSAVRAAGSACARNAVALFVPCHRVLRSDGSLGGFRWGLDVKRWLLQHEYDRSRRG